MAVNKEEIEALKVAFYAFDENYTGYLDINQFFNIVAAMGQDMHKFTNISNETMYAVFNYFDIDDDGHLSFNEVYGWWISNMRFSIFSGKKSELLVKAHDLYHKHTASSKMRYNEFENMLEALGVEHRESIFDELDRDGDGLLNFTEFVDWLGWLNE